MTSIVFMGTPQFSVPILEALVAHDYQVLAVVTQPDRKVGRKQVLQQTPVKEAAVRLNLTVFQPEKLSGSQELADVMALQPDLIVTAAYGQFLPTKLLEAAKIAAINVHGSLLPKYRGGAPIQYAVLNGDSEIGITIMHMAKKMDAGDMIEQASIPIEASDDTGTLFDKLSYVGRDLLLKTLPSIIDQTAPRTPQDEAQVTFAYNITKEQEQLDIEQPATQLVNQIRALRPQPGAWLPINGQRTKLWQATVAETTTDQPAGVIVAINKKDFELAAGNGSVLKITEIQPAGKAKMPVQSFLNGVGKQLAVGQQVVVQDA
ncbi:MULTISPECIES: methionyl-tRNA formyltransferase [Latilactobacillus]|jgi:methionyl-tRNA formyltransferase|uniref:Methionyl-tRNA formyltransferase n=2 Tax=Latilactobacillus curvatus TaxID=28038 RepID=A0A385AEP1_LATCU|nr:methionyl-tRNA formyltransferase [Latilactobacillus curvatus]ANJ69099.1 methionyl-tRNA formyltransferase [Latilactobacillus curvatus]AOO75769.1 methionyl-tRNA formyltransferase [Latilactobacillus curvatus]AWV73208.1 methionyl-tRNA formyltransferase [Latilactobacillus curvatus]AXN36130.1 methionyl-tRNA formyltransferase [Latilactobacillus curvatus]AZP96087.1 methionyl-tRNA formyltransferase [Latilactobacillus curvatus]